MARHVAPRYVVGLGASAGGLDALQVILPQLVATGTVSYVIAQHMAHDGHSDLMARLLNRCSPLKVQVPEEGEVIRPDIVYLLPAGCDGEILGGRFVFKPRGTHALSAPSANALFASLAHAYGERAVAIVLSGTGSDGTAGCRAVQSKGGLTLAQDASSAMYDGMPSSAVRAGVVAQVLSDQEIGQSLLGFLPGVEPLASVGRAPVAPVVTVAPEAPVPPDPQLAALLAEVRSATGVDFSGYKEDTLRRRLAQRMNALRIADIETYRQHAHRHADEWARLQQAMLVSVSSFFRNRQSFVELAGWLMPQLSALPPSAAIRIWVPGCAAGEEVYTFAILLLEGLGPTAAQRKIEVLGSDLNAAAIAIAEEGLYRPSAFKEMEPALQARYFVPRGDGLAVSAAVKSLCRFERCDVLQTPMDRVFDAISCRNLLIYLKPPLQDALMRRLHRQLVPGGLLMLGDAEHLSAAGNTLFSTLSYGHRVFRRRAGAVGD